VPEGSVPVLGIPPPMPVPVSLPLGDEGDCAMRVAPSAKLKGACARATFLLTLTSAAWSPVPMSMGRAG
jgi:hypothetical protein